MPHSSSWFPDAPRQRQDPSRLRSFFPRGLVRYLGAASLVESLAFLIVRCALGLHYRNFQVLFVGLLAWTVIALASAFFLMRRFTGTKWAALSLVVGASIVSYGSYRFVEANSALVYYQTLVQPVLADYPVVDLRHGVTAPHSFQTLQPLDTTVIHGFQVEGSDTSSSNRGAELSDLMRNLSKVAGISCNTDIESSLRAVPSFGQVDLGSKEQSDRLICAGTLASLTFPRNSVLYVDSHRVIACSTEDTCRSFFQEYRGDTLRRFFPDTTVARVLRKRDSLRRREKDSLRALSGR